MNPSEDTESIDKNLIFSARFKLAEKLIAFEKKITSKYINHKGHSLKLHLR